MLIVGTHRKTITKNSGHNFSLSTLDGEFQKFSTMCILQTAYYNFIWIKMFFSGLAKKLVKMLIPNALRKLTDFTNVSIVFEWSTLGNTVTRLTVTLKFADGHISIRKMVRLNLTQEVLHAFSKNILKDLKF